MPAYSEADRTSRTSIPPPFRLPHHARDPPASAHNRRVIVSGYHGTASRPTLVVARLNWPCVRVNPRQPHQPHDLIGDAIVIRDGVQVTEFATALAGPTAQRGACFDEYDAPTDDVRDPARAGVGRLTLTPDRGSRIRRSACLPPPTHRLGDTSGYTAPADQPAQMDRWSIVTTLNICRTTMIISCSPRRSTIALSGPRHRQQDGAGCRSDRNAFERRHSTVMSLAHRDHLAENADIFMGRRPAFRLTFLNK